jgi:hypothetical protein
MATKNEIENFLVSDFQATKKGEDFFSKKVEIDKKQSQIVGIYIMDNDWLQISIPLEKLTEGKVNDFLSFSGIDYPIGGLIKIVNKYFYRQSVSVEYFSPDLFITSLAHTLKCVIKLKEKLGIT